MPVYIPPQQLDYIDLTQGTEGAILAPTEFHDQLANGGRDLFLISLSDERAFQEALSVEDSERYARLHQRMAQQLRQQFMHERQLNLPQEFTLVRNSEESLH